MKFKKFIKKEHQIRHAILEQLFNSAESEKNPQYPKLKVDSVNLANLTGIPIKDITDLHEHLHEEGEIKCCFDEGNPVHNMVITSKGRQSYINKKLLIEGRKAYWDELYDPAKIIIPIAALVISLGTLGYTIYSNGKVAELKSKIEAQQIQINDLSVAKTSELVKHNSVTEKRVQQIPAPLDFVCS